MSDLADKAKTSLVITPKGHGDIAKWQIDTIIQRCNELEQKLTRIQKLFTIVPKREYYPNDQFYINALEGWIELRLKETVFEEYLVKETET